MTRQDISYAVRTGEPVETVPASSAAEVQAALDRATAAAPVLAARHPADRQRWLEALAHALEQPTTAEQLVPVADRETGLGSVRLAGELARCAAQLRFYGQVAADGGHLGATIDHRTDTTPDLRRVRVPLGPVAVLGASNFPFAFGVLGNDTGSALAAGCPVVAKAHPAHPATSRAIGEVASTALAGAGAPAGTFELVAGFDAGTSLVLSPAITAVAFTGSKRGGMALWRLANGRDEVVPVYAEMSTVNPAVMTTAATARAEEIAAGFVGSFTLGSGQFCTKPGLLLVPAGHDLPRTVGDALAQANPQGWLLTEEIAASFARGVEELLDHGARVVAQLPAQDQGWSGPATVLAASAATLTAGSRLLEECFGPVAIVVEYADQRELSDILAHLQGALAGSVMSAGPDDPQTPGLVAALAPHVGRVAVDDWPTGVAFTWAQQHGGPWPATTVPSATSVGAAALDRFTRPLTWQSVPDPALPAALQESNPWHLARRVDGVMVPA